MATFDKNKLIPKEPLKNLKDDAKETKDLIDSLTQSVEMLGEAGKVIKKEMQVIQPKTVKDLQDFEQLARKSNEAAFNRLSIDKDIAKQKIRLQELQKTRNKELREEVKLEGRQLGTLEKLARANTKLRDERKGLNLETAKGKARLLEINKTLDKNNDTIKENSDELKKQKLNVGNYADSWKAAGTSILKTVGLITGAIASLKGLFDISNEQDQINKRLTNSFGLQGEALADTRKQVQFLSKAYGKEINEVLDTATVLTNEFKLSQEEAFKLLDKGFAKGADVRGDFLEQLKEYSTQFVSVGLSASEAIAVITQQEQQGVFSDKGVDAIKEAGIRLTELPKATNEALKAIGLSGIEIQNQINNGQKTVFEATQEISAEMAKLPPNSREVGMVLADVFGGAGEDAKGFVLGLHNVSTELDDLNDTTTDYEKAQQSIIKQFIELKDEIAQGALPVFTFLAKNFKTIIGLALTAGKIFLIYRARLIAVNIAQKLFATESGKMSFSLKNLVSNLKKGDGGLGKFKSALKGLGFATAISFAQQYAVELINIANGAFHAASRIKALQKITDRVTKSTDEFIQKRRKALKDEVNEIRKKNLSQAEENKLIKEQTEAVKEQNTADIERIRASKIRLSNRKAEAKENLRIFQQRAGNTPKEIVLLGKLRTKVSELAKQEEQRRIELEGLRSFQEELNEALTEGEIETAKYTTATGDLTEKTKEAKKAVKDLTDEILRQAEVEKTMISEREAFQLENLRQQSDEILQIEQERARRTGKVTNDLFNRRLDEEKKLREAILERILITSIDEATAAEDVELASQRFDQAQARLDKEFKDRRKAAIDSLNASQEEFADNQTDRLKEETEVEEEELEKRFETRNKFLRATEKAITDSIDKRIKKVEEEKSAAEKQFDFLSGLAESGNIKAQQSLKEEQRIIREAEAERERLEKRKQDILLVSAVLQSFNSNLAAGDDTGTAFTKAIATEELLTTFISTLSGFYDGTENTGTSGIFRDKDGAITGYTHENERVINAKENAQIGNFSNSEVARTMEAVRLGKLNDGISFSVNSNGELVEQMKANTQQLSDIKKVLIDQPEHSSETANIVSDVLLLRDRTTKGGITTQRTFRVE